MRTLAAGYRHTHPQRKDAGAVLRLIETCEQAEYGSADTDDESLEEEWSRLDLERDADLFYDPANRLVGYAATSGDGDNYQIDFFAHPQRDWLELEDTLLQEALRRVKARMTEAHTDQARVRSYVAHANREKRDAIERFGFRPVRYHLQMQIDLDSPPEEAKFAPQYSLSTCDPQTDAPKIYDLMRTAFANPERPFPAFEDWQGFMIDNPQFNPDLWFLLEEDGKLVGASLCYDYPSYGWVRQLGVLPERRRGGLGVNLLLASFGAFYRRGRRRVALGVAAENANAQALYERAGMHVARQYDEYLLNLSVNA